MKSKFVLLAFIACAFTNRAFCMEGDILLPDLTNWDGKSDIDGWVPDPKRITKAPAGMDWYVYHLWILNPREGRLGRFCTKGRDEYPLHVILKSPQGYTMSFCKKVDKGQAINPLEFYFEEDPEEKGWFVIKSPYLKEGGASGHKFDAWCGKKAFKNTQGMIDVPSDLHLKPNQFPKSAVFRVFSKINKEEDS